MLSCCLALPFHTILLLAHTSPSEKYEKKPSEKYAPILNRRLDNCIFSVQIITMRQFILCLSLALASFSSLQAQNWQQGAFQFGGANREYKTYHAASTQQDMAVVIMLHGLGGSMNDVDMTSFKAIADTTDLLLVSPEALEFTHPVIGAMGPAWNSGIKVTGTPLGDIELNPGVNDVGFLKALVDTIKANYNVDEARIFICGFSNGGFMTQRMLCEQPGLFRAAASHSGTKALTLTQCSDIKVPVAHFHGTTDNVVDINGNFYMMGLSAPVGLSVDSLVNYWRMQNNAGNVGATAIIGNQSSANYITHYTFTGDKRVEYFKIENGMHTWYNFGTTQNEFDLAFETWQFFLRSEPKGVNIANTAKKEAVTVFPNPANHILYINNQGQVPFTKLSVIDLSGRIVLNMNYTSTVDISSLSGGMYILQVQDAVGKQRVVKFAKN